MVLGEKPGDPEAREFGAYWSDREAFSAAQGRSTVRPGQRTLEAELMDWSDDITYAVCTTSKTSTASGWWSGWSPVNCERRLR